MDLNKVRALSFNMGNVQGFLPIIISMFIGNHMFVEDYGSHYDRKAKS